MIVKRPEIERTLDAGGAGHRLILLYGPDESGSRALADRIARPLGADVERIDLAGATLKADPALLADEASAISLFGSKRFIRIEPAGDEIIDAVTALLELSSSSDPVVIVAGALRKDAKLVKLATASPDVIGFASYVPEGADADRMTNNMARDHGLLVTPDVARRLATACNGDRAILAREIEKLALFVDAAPDRPRELGHEELDALGAASEEGDMGKLVDAVLDGRLEAIEAALAQLAAEGIEGIPLIRAMLRRLLQLAEFRAEVARGSSVSSVMASAGKSLFWKDRDTVARQVSRWRPAQIATAIERLMATERAVKASGTAGSILLDEELLAIGRAARRMR
jgi:DNA polymerase-3 subunit delta